VPRPSRQPRSSDTNSDSSSASSAASQPLATNFITGGGYIVNPSNGSGTYAGAGQYAGTPGLKTNFGFNVKYNKGGTNLQGHVNIIVRQGAKTYQIMSTALQSLGVLYYNSVTQTYGPSPGGTCTTTATAACPIKATFVSKGNLNDITNGSSTSVFGGGLLTMSVTDRGSPGVADTIAITLNNGSTVAYSSSWNTTSTVEIVLGAETWLRTRSTPKTQPGHLPGCVRAETLSPRRPWRPHRSPRVRPLPRRLRHRRLVSQPSGDSRRPAPRLV
jgi:hypothetical protein